MVFLPLGCVNINHCNLITGRLLVEAHDFVLEYKLRSRQLYLRAYYVNRLN